MRASLALAILIAAVVLSSSAAAEPLELPSPAPFEELADGLRLPATSPYWTCAPRGDLCSEVAIELPGSTVILEGVIRDASGLHAKMVHLVWNDGELLGLRDLLLSSEEEFLILEASSGHLVSTDEELRFEAVRVQYQENRVRELFLSELSWLDETGLVATAVRAELRDGVWHLEGFELHGPGPRTARAGPGQIPRGWLPPTVEAGDAGVYAEGLVHLGDPALSLGASADTALTGGLFLAHWSQPTGLCAREPCGHYPLRLQGRINPDGWEVELQGEAFTDGRARHGALDLDGVAHSGGSGPPPITDRLRRQGLFHETSRQRAGLSLSGVNRELTVSALTIADTRALQVRSLFEEARTEVRVHYGTRLQLDEQTSASIAIGHGEVLEGPPARETRVRAAGERILGSLNRAYLRPALQGELVFQAQHGDDGTTSDSFADIDALLEGGLGLTGAPGGLSHRLRPRLVLGRRLVGELGPRNLAGAGVHQTFQGPRGASLSLPVEAVLRDDGRLANWRPALRGQAVADMGPLLLHSQVTCDGLCDEVRLLTMAQVSWTATIRTIHVGRWQSAEWIPIPLFDDARSSLLERTQDQTGGLHLQGVRVSRGQYFGEASLHGSLEDPLRGAEVAVGYYSPRVGWGVEARSAAEPAEGQWAVLVGIRTSPGP